MSMSKIKVPNKSLSHELNNVFIVIFNEMQYHHIGAIAGPFFDIMKVMMKGPNKQSTIKKLLLIKT